MVTIAVKRDFEAQLIINKVSETQKDQSFKLKEGDLPSVMSPIYLPFISSSCTGEKKCTDKAYQVLLEHGYVGPSFHLSVNVLHFQHFLQNY